MVNRQTASKDIDPIGIELAIAIFSTTLTTISFVCQFRSVLRRKGKASNSVHEVRREVLRLQNALDDLILTIERLSHHSKEFSFADKTPTISQTMMRLSRKDYQRWILINDAIKRVDHKLYEIISEVRDLVLDEELEDIKVSKITEKADSLLLGMGNTTFSTFVAGLRQLLSEVDADLANIHQEGNSTQHPVSDRRR